MLGRFRAAYRKAYGKPKEEPKRAAALAGSSRLIIHDPSLIPSDPKAPVPTYAKFFKFWKLVFSRQK